MYREETDDDTVLWDMMKPLISDKASKINSNITLIDDSKIINDPKNVLLHV